MHIRNLAARKIVIPSDSGWFERESFFVPDKLPVSDGIVDLLSHCFLCSRLAIIFKIEQCYTE